MLHFQYQTYQISPSLQILDSELFELMHQNGDYTHFYFCYRWFLLDFKRGNGKSANPDSNLRAVRETACQYVWRTGSFSFSETWIILLRFTKNVIRSLRLCKIRLVLVARALRAVKPVEKPGQLKPKLFPWWWLFNFFKIPVDFYRGR